MSLFSFSISILRVSSIAPLLARREPRERYALNIAGNLARNSGYRQAQTKRGGGLVSVPYR
jgi:hypothetical protein